MPDMIHNKNLIATVDIIMEALPILLYRWHYYGSLTHPPLPLTLLWKPYPSSFTVDIIMEALPILLYRCFERRYLSSCLEDCSLNTTTWKGPANLCNNYRPNSLLSCGGKA